MTPEEAIPEQPTAVRLLGVSKSFGEVRAVSDVHLDVRSGEFFSLLGPSGCGKTTLLRMIAGFEQPDAGRILIAGEDVTERSPQRRPTAMVFQNYALFPTMTVGENTGYGLRVRRVPKADRQRRVADLLARVDLPGMEQRPVTQLSGGQQQRVALARAMAVEPDVVLFDEPLSNLDVALREQTRRELKLLQHRLGTTSIYVTHDQQEALALSDRIAVMRAGRVLQIAPPRELFQNPATAFVAQFMGWNLLPDGDVARNLSRSLPEAGTVLGVRPEDLGWQRDDESSADGAPGSVVAAQFLGTYTEWVVELSGAEMRVWTSPDEQLTAAVRLVARRWKWLMNDLRE